MQENEDSLGHSHSLPIDHLKSVEVQIERIEQKEQQHREQSLDNTMQDNQSIGTSPYETSEIPDGLNPKFYCMFQM